MNIYISAPITGRTEDDNDFLFEYVKGQIRYWGHFVIDPWAIGKLLPKLSHEDYMAIDKEIILRGSDAVFFAPGWKTSKGCQIEHDFCEKEGIKMYHDISEIAKEADDEVAF